MKPICSNDSMKAHFGSLYTEAVRFMTETYPFLIIDNDEVFLQLSLETIFSEPMELFSVDSSLVSDVITITDMCKDETVDAEIQVSIQDWLEELWKRDPLTGIGEVWMTFQEIQEWYGPEFDADMKRFFPEQYDEFKSYMLDE
jgi:hypothetical protein